MAGMMGGGYDGPSAFQFNSTPSANQQAYGSIAELGNKSGVAPGLTAQQLAGYGAPGTLAALQAALNQNAQTANNQQNSQNQLLQGNQQGAFGVLNTLLNQNYLDQGQVNAAKGEYGDVVGGLSDAITSANNLAGNGLFSNDQRKQFNSSYDPAMASAQDYSKTGGIGDDEYNALMNEFGADRGQLQTIAGRGGLTADEYGQNLSSGYQSVLDAAKDAAQSGYNSANLGSTPFAAMSVMSNGAANAGKNRAAVKADLDKYQSDTRLQAQNALESLLGKESDTRMSRASNKGKGLDAMTSLLSALTGYQGKDAQGKVDALSSLNQLLGTKAGVASQMAGIDTKTAPAGGSPYADLINNLMGELQNTVNVPAPGTSGKKVAAPKTTANATMSFSR